MPSTSHPHCAHADRAQIPYDTYSADTAPQTSPSARRHAWPPSAEPYTNPDLPEPRPTPASPPPIQDENTESNPDTTARNKPAPRPPDTTYYPTNDKSAAKADES